MRGGKDFGSLVTHPADAMITIGTVGTGSVTFSYQPISEGVTTFAYSSITRYAQGAWNAQITAGGKTFKLIDSTLGGPSPSGTEGSWVSVSAIPETSLNDSLQVEGYSGPLSFGDNVGAPGVYDSYPYVRLAAPGKTISSTDLSEANVKAIVDNSVTNVPPVAPVRRSPPEPRMVGSSPAAKTSSIQIQGNP